MHIATWNLRGILDINKQKDLVKDLENYNVDILTVQETYLRDTGSLDLPLGKSRNQFTLHYTGPKDSSHHGVGIIVRKDTPAKFRRISDRVCQLTIDLSEVEHKPSQKK